MKTFRLIGLMSGTSLDGLDIADVSFFFHEDDSWSFTLNHSVTVPYEEHMHRDLSNAHSSSGESLHMLSVELALFYSDQINRFISTNKIDRNQIDAIASHGQTIFHQPEKLFTLQIGNLPHLATHTGCTLVTDFRTKDVALGGTGAPLIPFVDHTLFSGKADAFLNLGGFSNLSYQLEGKVYSHDVGPANIVINYLVQKHKGLDMDRGGEMAKSGSMINELFENLNRLAYYQKSGPKSLGWEWVEENILPQFNDSLSLEDCLHTYIKHMVFQLIRSFEASHSKSVFLTGGGVHNDFLIESLKDEFDGSLVIPSKEIIDYKEAIGFAFLGLMRMLGKVNVWSTVTGASKDSCSGVIYEP